MLHRGFIGGNVSTRLSLLIGGWIFIGDDEDQWGEDDEWELGEFFGLKCVVVTQIECMRSPTGAYTSIDNVESDDKG